MSRSSPSFDARQHHLVEDAGRVHGGPDLPETTGGDHLQGEAPFTIEVGPAGLLLRPVQQAVAVGAQQQDLASEGAQPGVGRTLSERCLRILVAAQQLFGQRPPGGHRMRGVQTAQHARVVPEALRQRPRRGRCGQTVEGRGRGGHIPVRTVAAAERGHHHRAPLAHDGEERVDHRVGATDEIPHRVQGTVHADQVTLGQPQPAEVLGQSPHRHAPQDPVAQRVPGPVSALGHQASFQRPEHSCSSSNASMKNFVAQLRTMCRPYSPSTGQDPASPPRIAGSAEEMSWRAIR